MSAFWAWALEAYARPGVADACIELQDRHGQNVPLVLWVVWAGRHAGGGDLERGAALAARWETAAGALRSVRRSLKSDLPDLPSITRETFRRQVKAVELEGERVLMAALEDLPSTPETGGSEAERLARVSEAYGARVGPEVFTGLLARL